MMSSESLLALEPCGQSRLRDRELELGPALAKDSYIKARDSLESGVPDRIPPVAPSPAPAHPLGSRRRWGGDALTPRSGHPRRGPQAAAGSSPPR